MTDQAEDALVIGAGHNGLACAAYLARSGRKVLVLEARQRPGGLAATREFAEGFQVSAAAHLLNMLSPLVVKDLALERHGLTYAARHLKTVVLSGDGRQLIIDGGRLEGASANDQAAYTEFQRQMQRFTKVLSRFCARPFPHLAERRGRDNLLLAKLAWDVRTLGKSDMRELLRIGAINIHDLAEEKFESPLLKAALSMDAVLGSHMGPRSPNTVYTYLHRHLNDGGTGPALVQGGMGALGDAFAAAAEAAGATIRYGARISRIDVADCRTAGVTLADGSAIAAPLVVSNADLKSTFRLVGPLNLDAGFVRRVHNFRARGVTAKLHLALDGLPEIPGLDPADAGSRLLAAATMDDIEGAFNQAKYGECSPEPVMEISIPTVHDESLAPPGKHVLSAVAQYAPYALKGGWPAGRETFMQSCLARLEAIAPGIREQTTAAELLTPPDLEAQFGLRGGHWHHGEIALDQALFTRPVPGANHYATPVPGLYLCGASAHPGGGLLGLAGRNAAAAILAGEAAS